MIAPLDVFKHAQTLHTVWDQTFPTWPPSATEASLRCVTSRYYYAAFSYADDLATDHGYFHIPGDRSHDNVWGHLRKRYCDDLQDAYHDLKQLRVQADYHLDDPPDWTLKEVKDKTESLIQMINRHRVRLDLQKFEIASNVRKDYGP